MKITAIFFGLSIFILSSAAILASSAAEAKPGGCLKYGVAGAVAGHYADHHAVKGAIAGCVLGMVRRHEYNKQQKQMNDKAGGAPAAH
ncbi:MAG: hypothetical protein WCF20_10740 [Methylovirgula sp.]